jgi:hypothetical protein
MKLKNISIKNDKKSLRAEISFLFKDKEEKIWFETKDIDLSVGDPNTAFLSIAILPAMLVGEDIDMSNFSVSEKLLSSVHSIQEIYFNWFKELDLKKVNILNATADNRTRGQGGITASFFSGGIDSFYTVLNSEENLKDKKIQKLIYIYGYDIRLGDSELFSKTKEHLDITANDLGKQILYISTNLREFTEKILSWDFIHGAALIAIAHIFSGSIETIYISASNSIGQLTPNGSHPQLDPLFESEKLKIIHYGIEQKRIEKIINRISKSSVALSHLRVCWKNSGGDINCGVCEKCVRTMIALEAGNVLDRAKTFNNRLDVSLLSNVVIPNEGIANLYCELIPYLHGNDILDKLKVKISEMLDDFDQVVAETKSMNKEITKSNGFIKKDKNILFIDFNGVVSYNPFWVTLKNPDHEMHKYSDFIEKYLFKDNISIVMDWMIGKYTSEEIHKLLEKEVGAPYDKLFPIFCQECANIDISEKILEKVRNLRKYYYCILITDNMDSFDRFTLTNNPILKDSFDQIDNSYTIKLFKKANGGQYFKDRINEQKAITVNCILVDDSKNNCALFESLGGKAFITKAEDQVLGVLDSIEKKLENKWEWQY